MSASRLAQPDVGILTQSEMVETTRFVVKAAGNVPVVVDGDTGFGGANNIRRTIRDLASAGAAAVSIEDQCFPKKCTYAAGSEVQVVSQNEATKRIMAAVSARDEARSMDGNSILIIARTDCRNGLGLEEAISRCKMFEELGADIVYAENLQSEQEYFHLRASLKTETKTMLAQIQLSSSKVDDSSSPLENEGFLLSSDKARVMGYDFVLFGITTLQATIGALRNTALQMLSNEGLILGQSNMSLCSFGDVKEVLDFDNFEDFESKFC